MENKKKNFLEVVLIISEFLALGIVECSLRSSNVTELARASLLSILIKMRTESSPVHFLKIEWHC